MNHWTLLSSPFEIKGLRLKNRITMTPLFVGYAQPDGTVSDLMVDHYREMGASGASMVVVENVGVDPSGLGSPFMARADHDRYISGLSRLAEAIQGEGALAFCQINHAGRYAFGPERMAPSPVKTGDVVPKEMSREEIATILRAFGDAAKRVKQAGFDGVEIHGGTGYLLAQFLSARTNRRQDEYGGSLESRMR
ncbi:MAG: NADH:flavin oxidoreductase, partial [Deltaproteobacteria bacterium]|nr:NADH:flavin oxidoreductase [Deltaproteobacteria bacterium]